MIGHSRIAAEKDLPCSGCVWNVGIAQITRKMFAGIPLLKRRKTVTRKDGPPAGMDAQQTAVIDLDFAGHSCFEWRA